MSNRNEEFSASFVLGVTVLLLEGQSHYKWYVHFINTNYSLCQFVLCFCALLVAILKAKFNLVYADLHMCMH